MGNIMIWYGVAAVLIVETAALMVATAHMKNRTRAASNGER